MSMNPQYLRAIGKDLNPKLIVSDDSVHKLSTKPGGIIIIEQPRFHWFGLRRLFAWAVECERRRRWRAYALEGD